MIAALAGKRSSAGLHIAIADQHKIAREISQPLT
jgi:hypothetical protein